MTIQQSQEEQVIKTVSKEVIDELQKNIEDQIFDTQQCEIVKKSSIHKKIKKPKIKESFTQRKVGPSLHHLRQLRQSKLVQLKEIQHQQNILKKSLMLNSSKVSNSSSKLERSHFTESQMVQIKKIINEHKKFERQLKKKEEDLETWLQNKRKEQEELRKKYLVEQCEQRKKELIRQREQQQKRKQKQKKQFQLQIKKLKQLKAKRYLHQQMIESWKKYQQATELQKEKMWEEEKMKRKIDPTTIKDHEVKYLEIKKKEQKKREQTLQQSRSEKHHLPYIRSSIFYEVQKQEKEKNRIEQIKIHQKQENVAKSRLYSKHVKDLFLPRLKSTSPNLSQKHQQAQSPKKQVLGVEQSFKLGNEYMKTAHQKVTSDQIEKLKNSLNIVEEAGGHSIRYKNYLKDLKLQRQKQNKPSTLKMIETTLKNKQMTSTDKIHKVQMIFEKDRTKKRSDSQLVDIIKSKMKVLQEIIG